MTALQGTHSEYIDGVVQENRNSCALAMDLHLSCTNLSIYRLYIVYISSKLKLWIATKIKALVCHFYPVIYIIICTIMYIFKYISLNLILKIICDIGFCERKSPVTGELPTNRTSNAENVSIWWRHHVNNDQVGVDGCSSYHIIWGNG